MSLYNQNKMSRPFKLFRLQQIDSQLDALRLRQGEIESALQDDTRIRQIVQKMEDCKTEWAAAKKALHLAEDETQKQRIKIELTESALYGGKVRNPKELQDLQNRICFSEALPECFGRPADRDHALGRTSVRSS